MKPASKFKRAMSMALYHRKSTRFRKRIPTERGTLSYYGIVIPKEDEILLLVRYRHQDVLKTSFDLNHLLDMPKKTRNRFFECTWKHVYGEIKTIVLRTSS